MNGIRKITVVAAQVGRKTLRRFSTGGKCSIRSCGAGRAEDPAEVQHRRKVLD